MNSFEEHQKAETNEVKLEILNERMKVLEHEVKILKRTIGMGDLEQVPAADYELEAETCPHRNWDRDYDNGVRTCKNCGHQEELY